MLKKTILKNGLRVILVPQSASLAASVLVLVEAGSEYETKEINGLSHFLEHLMFKGTVNRPKPGMISTELDSLGAEYNAFTSQEYTGYWAKAESHKLPQILDLVSDLYLNPVFNPAEIEKERGVIIEEINMYEDTPMRRVEELFMNLLYGNQPAGWDIAGEKDVIRRLAREDFEKYRGTHYVAPKTVVVVSGNFDPEKIMKDVENLFGHLKKASKVSKLKTIESQDEPRTTVKFKDSDQTHLVMGVRAFDVFDERRYALQVLAEVLGGGMSSRLFTKVRGELGAAYYIRATADLFLDHGILSVSSGVDNARADKVIEAILGELDRLRTEEVGEKELDKAKEHLIGSLVLSLETSDEIGAFYGVQEILTGKPKEVEEMIKKVRAVKAAEILALAKSLLREDKLNLAIIGPYKDPAPFEKVLSF